MPPRSPMHVCLTSHPQPQPQSPLGRARRPLQGTLAYNPKPRLPAAASHPPMRTLASQAALQYAASLGCTVMHHKTNFQPAADVGKLLTMMETEVRALIAPA